MFNFIPMIWVRVVFWLIGLVFSVDSVQGQTTWRRTYGGYATDHAQSVLETSDGGYLISGTTGSFGFGASDMYLVKVNAEGEHQWSGVYGGAGVETNVMIKETSLGYLLAGSTSNGSQGGYDFYLIMIDQSGEFEWERTFGTADWDLCHAMDVSPDAVYLSGITYGNGNTEGRVHLVCADLLGNHIWSYTDTVNGTSSCLGMRTHNGFNYLVGKKAISYNYDAIIICVDIDGDESWRVSFGGEGDDYFNSITISEVNDVIAAGVTKSLSDFERIWLVRVDPEGDYVWDRDIGTNSADAGATHIELDHDSNGFVFTGYNRLNLGEPDMILTAVDEDGWFLWGDNYGVGVPALGNSVIPTSDGGYIIVGWTEGHGPGIQAMYAVKTDAEGLTVPEVIPFVDPVSILTPRRQELSIHPNPITPGATLNFTIPQIATISSITLSDLTGRVISRSNCSKCTTFQIPQIASGMYQLIFRLQNGGSIAQSIVVD